MPKQQLLTHHLDFGAILDGLDQGILLFDADDRLILDNLAARRLLKTDIITLRAHGWAAAESIVNVAGTESASLDDIRIRALRQIEPVHFEAQVTGEPATCAATAIYGKHGHITTMLVIERPNWTPMVQTLAQFHDEFSRLVESAQGHAGLIQKVLEHADPDAAVDTLQTRVLGFSQALTGHMRKLTLLTEALQRLTIVRSDQLAQRLAQHSRTFEVAGFIEDLIEDLQAILLLDEDLTADDVRTRLRMRVPPDLYVASSRLLLTRILRDILRNSLMYSPPNTPITLRASCQGQHVQLDITDTGYGIRASEYDAVFAPFLRAAQPHILAEHGYGISLYLARAELEAIGGTIWFTSQEKQGTTFSLTLPAAPSEHD